MATDSAGDEVEDEGMRGDDLWDDLGEHEGEVLAEVKGEGVNAESGEPVTALVLLLLLLMLSLLFWWWGWWPWC